MNKTGSIENYITVTFSKLTDNHGKPIDIGLALPTLVKIVSGNSLDFIQQKYDFLGEAAFRFAMNMIVAKHYPQFDNRILSALIKKIHDLARVHKILDQEIHLKDHVLSPYLSQTMNSIVGVLNNFYGIKVVEKLIEPAVLHITGTELGLVQAKKDQLKRQKPENENPIQALNQLIYAKKGTIESVSQEAPNQSWQVAITAKFHCASLLFSHSRISQSKQKAKTEAAKDILNFLTQRPDVYDQLQQPSNGMTEVHALPISKADYYHIAPAVSTHDLFQQGREQQGRVLNTTDWAGGDPNHIHISCADDEDAIELMSNLLLNGQGGSMDVDMSDESPTKKRQRQGVFGTFCDSVDTNDDSSMSSAPSCNQLQIKKEDSDVNQARASILAAIQQPPSSQPAPVNYIKSEEEFNPFNKPLAAPVYNDKAVAFFKKMFSPHRHVLAQTLELPGQSKSVVLSLVVQHQDTVYADVKAEQGGPSHGPVFNSVVTLTSKVKPQVFLKTEGVAKRKKDAEQMAFARLIELIR